MFRHYCIYTAQITAQVLADLRTYGANNIETHVNRTRFWLDLDSDIRHATLFLKYSSIIHHISHETDHTLGQ